MSLRRNLTIAVAAGSAAAAGLTAVAITAATSQASTEQVNRATVFKAVLTQESEVDDGKKGVNAGDRFTFADDLYRWGGKAKVGTDGGDCVVVHARGEKVTVHCVATLSLKGGQVTVQGLTTFTDGPFTVAVTGGTGMYRGASGTLTVDEQSEKVSKLTLRLDRDSWSHPLDSDDDWSDPDGGE